METGITAVVIGGGQSECLQAGDKYIPKSLAPVAGRPLLEHQLEWLKRAGIDSAVLCLEYQSDQVRARFGDGSALGVRLRYSVAQAPRGTAGLVKALGPASLPDDVLVLFGGILPETDCGRMIRFHARLPCGPRILDVAWDSSARVTGLFGPSGAGKTTVLRALAGLTRPLASGLRWNQLTVA